MNRIDIKVGDKYNFLSVLNEEPFRRKPSGQIERMFKLKCECGNIIITCLYSFKSGHTKSCGCHNKVRTKETSTIHGHSSKNGKRNYTPTYQSWRCMRERCLYPKNIRWEQYGGRGITICDRWLKSFNNFLEDMGERPNGTTIDRINVNGNYEPSNCRWATPTEQVNNKRKKQNKSDR